MSIYLVHSLISGLIQELFIITMVEGTPLTVNGTGYFLKEHANNNNDSQHFNTKQTIVTKDYVYKQDLGAEVVSLQKLHQKHY